jgi:hypothetical protein
MAYDSRDTGEWPALRGHGHSQESRNTKRVDVPNIDSIDTSIHGK